LGIGAGRLECETYLEGDSLPVGRVDSFDYGNRVLKFASSSKELREIEISGVARVDIITLTSPSKVTFFGRPM
jgi:hypothetical protein